MLESQNDAAAVVKRCWPNAAPARKAGEALALMGHGHEHGRADLVFDGTRHAFAAQDELTFMATVEGARSFDDLLSELKAHKVKTVHLQPFMVVAGDHARNDLAGEDDDSWASKLKAAGFTVQSNLTGLGQIPAVCDIFIAHAKANTDDLTKEPRKQ